jgi:oxygen-independent coproporphyrinogen-3 oxidase
MASFHDELARRVALPQRHRLLQGYPMLPLMRRDQPGFDPVGLDGTLAWDPDTQRETRSAWIRHDASRPLIVGVLPHTQCNPRVAGCGFCTFPHDQYDKGLLTGTVDSVAEYARLVFDAYPELTKRRVDAVYFGGATANLTPARALSKLAKVLTEHLDFRHAEVTLEGVPSLFRSLLSGPFDALLDVPARHRRISMGVQTFDPAWIARMGRQSFGDYRTVAAVVEKAHRHGLTASGDFLVNLPGQPRADMLRDMARAEASGLDQVCVYHLVLTKGSGVSWSEDEDLMASLPDNATACDNWLAARGWLLEHGFVQTTLTNFERAGVHATERRFVYEEHSFSPERYDALGLGPTAISTFVDLEARRAVKHVRGKKAMPGDDLFFAYEDEDLRLLYLTRTLARLTIDRHTYERIFGADLTAHFGEALHAVVDAKLATMDKEAVRLTPLGMFFADSVAGLLAWPRVEALRHLSAGVHTRDLLERRVVLDYMG